MLKPSAIKQLLAKKNLLAFSAGVDSSALFFILKENKIVFDIAIVNYGVRQQSKEENSYAKELAKKYNLKCHTLNATPIEKNFEYSARKIRYDFFEELIQKYNYENLITAHHLGDRFEWMLMQFCKGAGCAEISGMQESQIRENYTLLRPLLHLDKEELLRYLKKKNHKYFEDESNYDEGIKRNEFRHKHATPLLQKHLNGIKKSFEYIDADVESLLQESKITTIKEFAYFKPTKSIRATIFTIDKYLKSQNYMLSASERETLKSDKTAVVGRKFIINQIENFIFIAPFTHDEFTLDSRFKDECRVLKIEPKLRKYLAQNMEVFKDLKILLGDI